MNKVLKGILNVIAWIILIFALIITILVFSSSRNNDVPSIFGFTPMTVKTNSMSPTFDAGDLIIVKKVDSVASLEVNDVITYWMLDESGNRILNTHRIVKVTEENGAVTYTTQGDNNPYVDTNSVSTGDIIGEWTETKISGFGKVMDFLRTKTGFLICILIPMAIFFLFELYKFIVTIIEVKKPQLTAEDEEEIKRRAIEEYLASQKQAQAPEENKSEENTDDSEKNEK